MCVCVCLVCDSLCCVRLLCQVAHCMSVKKMGTVMKVHANCLYYHSCITVVVRGSAGSA